MEQPQLLLAVDPGMACTGWAIMGRPESKHPNGKLINCGYVKCNAPGSSVFGRARVIVERLTELVLHTDPDLVIVEMPQTKTRGKTHARSVSSLPTYGVLCGAICFGVAPIDIVKPISATTWTKDMPSTYRDVYKTKRVMMAAAMYEIAFEAMGPKTLAGNVADAILLANWAWSNLVLDRIT